MVARKIWKIQKNKKKDKKEYKKQRKAQVWIPAVVYILTIAIIVALIFSAGLPHLRKSQDQAVLEKTENKMVLLDNEIRELASQAEGSQKVIPMDVQGKLAVDGAEGLVWELETSTNILEGRTTVEQGEVKISSGKDVEVREKPNSFVLANSVLEANISKIGSATNYTNYTTDQLVKEIKFLANNQSLGGNFNFSLAGYANSTKGNGYTELISSVNTSLDKATVKAYLNSSCCTYEIFFSLESKADFLRVKVLNVEMKS